jgi:hypothetical protein
VDIEGTERGKGVRVTRKAKGKKQKAKSIYDQLLTSNFKLLTSLTPPFPGYTGLMGLNLKIT